jgi:hypothetical protein
MTTSIEAFWETIDQVNGAYLDANAGFRAFREQIIQVQTAAMASAGMSRENLDAAAVFYGRGHPDAPDAVVQHKITQGQLKRRNLQNGDNSLFLGSMSVVAIYQFWEDRFRNEIASEMNIPRKELEHNLLGDLRLIRIAIVHHGGIAKREIEKCMILKWFKEGDKISINEDKMHELIVQLRSLCSDWSAQLLA